MKRFKIPFVEDKKVKTYLIIKKSERDIHIDILDQLIREGNSLVYEEHATYSDVCIKLYIWCDPIILYWLGRMGIPK
jgi:hypothetical protein